MYDIEALSETTITNKVKIFLIVWQNLKYQIREKLRALVTLTDFSYPVQAFWFCCSQRSFNYLAF
jgi:hypothetical protein